MILSYRKTKEGTSKPTNFEDKIKRGEKIHTIRLDNKNRWKKGMKIQQANGVRTKYYNCFQEDVCTGIQTIKIKHPKSSMSLLNTYYSIKVYIDDVQLGTIGIRELAINDGFNCMKDFLDWFNEDFEGKIIHWTDKRY